MNERFRELVEALHPKLEALLRMAPVLPLSLPPGAPLQGVYLFSEGDTHLYSGRGDNIRQRMSQHCTGGQEKAAFAFKLARIETGNVSASYKPEGSRAHLMTQPLFAQAFQAAKLRIQNMHMRYVEEADPLRQCLLEIYVAEVLKTPHNRWSTT